MTCQPISRGCGIHLGTKCEGMTAVESFRSPLYTFLFAACFFSAKSEVAWLARPFQNTLLTWNHVFRFDSNISENCRRCFFAGRLLQDDSLTDHKRQEGVEAILGKIRPERFHKV